MKRNQFDQGGIPFFFKLWFAFVAVLAICIMVGSGIAAIKIFETLQGATPETIGSVVGKAVAAYQKEAK